MDPDEDTPSFSVAGLIGWLLAHPTTLTVIGILAAYLLLSTGVIGPLDWWGSGREVGR